MPRHGPTHLHSYVIWPFWVQIPLCSQGLGEHDSDGELSMTLDERVFDNI
jgi:hypothetical protein